MALVTCPDCGRQISDAAPACLGCGRPMGVAQAVQQPVLMQAPMSYDQPITIEQTAKSWKLVQVVATLALFLGVFLAVAGAAGNVTAFLAIGWVLIIGGFVAILVARFGAWWSTG